MRIGVALGGGGVKGMAHVGVLRVLESAGIRVDVVAGSSSGAIVGALYAGGKSPEEIELLSRELSFRKWFARDRSGMGLFSTGGIHRIIDLTLGEGVRFEELPRAFACVAVDLDSQQEVVFDTGPVADAVCASAAYPGLFAPVQVGERYLFDGGVLNPVPFDVVRQHGADRVIAIDLGMQEPFFAGNSLVRLRRGGVLWQLLYSVSHQKVFRVIERSFAIMSQRLRSQKLALWPPDLVIYPDVRDIGLMDFDLMGMCMARGDAAAREALAQLEGLRVTARRARWTLDWRGVVERLRRVSLH